MFKLALSILYYFFKHSKLFCFQIHYLFKERCMVLNNDKSCNNLCIIRNSVHYFYNNQEVYCQISPVVYQYTSKGSAKKKKVYIGLMSRLTIPLFAELFILTCIIAITSLQITPT